MKGVVQHGVAISFNLMRVALHRLPQLIFLIALEKHTAKIDVCVCVCVCVSVCVLSLSTQETLLIDRADASFDIKDPDRL